MAMWTDEWLFDDEAAQWLARLAESPPVSMTALRKGVGSDRAQLLVEQAELRRRAASKFPHPSRMYFTRQGLEQASDGWIAEYKAARFPADRPLYDICTGIGGDLSALARHALRVEGIESDPWTALIAMHNAIALAPDDADIKIQMLPAAEAALAADAAWHADPDRRAHGGRTTHLEAYEPDLEYLQELRDEHPDGCLKLAPASEIPEEWSMASEREWVSRDGECRQQLLWSGKLASLPGETKATLVYRDGRGPYSVVALPHQIPPLAQRLGAYLYEPDAALLAAHLTGDLAARLGVAALAPQTAYFTSDVQIRDPAWTAFRIRDVLALDAKRIKAYLREHRIGRLEVKKRAAPVDIDKLRRDIRVPGDEQAVLFVTRWEGKVKAIIADRLTGMQHAGEDHAT